MAQTAAPPYTVVQQALTRHAAAIRDLLAAPVTAPRRPPAGIPPARRPAPATAVVIALSRGDRASLATALDAVATSASRLPDAQLEDFACDLAAGQEGGDAVRAALVVATPGEAAAIAARAAAVLREAGPGGLPRLPLRPQPRTGELGAGPLPGVPLPGEPAVHLSEGARGRVALLFSGLACTLLEHASTLSASMATLAAVKRLGIEPHLGIGYSLGEIIGLAWAEAITPGEAARLAALRAEILRAAPQRTGMARLRADRKTAASLLDSSGLAIAADEGPDQQVLAGPVADIQRLPRRAAALGATADVLGATCGLHSPAMRQCVMPMEAVAAGIRVTATRRRLISAVTGLDVATPGDAARLLARQLERPALLADALALASADADLILLAMPDPALARAAAACCRIPAVQPPLELRGRPAPAVLAALFAAGAIGTVRPLPAGGAGLGGFPVRAQRHPRDCSGGQLHAENLVKLDDVTVEA